MSNVKVKFKPIVRDIYYWSNEVEDAQQWIDGPRAHSNKAGLMDYVRHCESMYESYEGDLVKLTAELGPHIKFQWTYYITMTREEAFRLQLTYGDYIDLVRD